MGDTFYPSPYYRTKVVIAALFTVAFISYAILTYPEVHSKSTTSSASSLLGSRVWIEKENRYGIVKWIAVVNGEEYPMIVPDNDLKFITESPKKEDM